MEGVVPVPVEDSLVEVEAGILEEVEVGSLAEDIAEGHRNKLDYFLGTTYL